MAFSSTWLGMLRSILLVYIITVVQFTATTTNAWLLAQVGLNESYRVRHLSTHFLRVFLSISVESNTFPTLIESEWPPLDTYLPMRSAVFPHRDLHANGDHSDCSLLQQASWSQVDSLSRLWVFDIGWQNNDNTGECPPKLLVFDLIKSNVEVLRIDCSKYIEHIDAKLLVVKMGPKLLPCQVERFIYFIRNDEPYILSYDILEQNWHRRKLISKKYTNVLDAFPVKPNDFAFGKQRDLIVSDSDGSLYSSQREIVPKHRKSNVAQKANIIWDEDDDDIIEMELLGSLLGPSRGMMIDKNGALFYVVTKFGAVIRCEYKQNLTAEGNEIIYMTSKNIQQIFTGSKDSVWLLTDRLLKPQDHCFPGM